MKRFVCFLLILAAAVAGLGFWSSAQAVTDTFQITISVGYIQIALKEIDASDYLTWDAGSVSAGGIATMEGAAGSTQEGVWVDNSSNIAINLSCYAEDSSTWTLGSSAGTDIYVLRATSEASWVSGAYPNMSASTTILASGGSGTLIEGSIAAGADRYWYYDITAPSVVTTGPSNTITVTVNALGS